NRSLKKGPKRVDFGLYIIGRAIKTIFLLVTGNTAHQQKRTGMQDECHQHVLLRCVLHRGGIFVRAKGAVHDPCAVGALPTRDTDTTHAGLAANASTARFGTSYARCLWPCAQRLPCRLP